MNKLDKLKELLDMEYSWPAEYKFKFIVPAEKLEELKTILGEEELVLRPSSNGKYVSVTVKMQLSSGGEVILIYDKVQSIEGILSF